jgi:hypothetical protein
VRAVVAGAYAFAILVALGLVVAPRVFPTRRVSPILVVFTVVALTDAYGLAGLVAAPFLAAACQRFWEGIMAPHQDRPARHAADLEDRLAALHTRLRGQAALSPELAGVLARLDELVGRASKTL